MLIFFTAKQTKTWAEHLDILHSFISYRSENKCATESCSSFEMAKRSGSVQENNAKVSHMMQNCDKYFELKILSKTDTHDN